MFQVISLNNKHDEVYVSYSGLFNNLDDADKYAYKLANEDKNRQEKHLSVVDSDKCNVITYEGKDINEVEFNNTYFDDKAIKGYLCEIRWDELHIHKQFPCSYHIVISVDLVTPSWLLKE